MIAYEVLCQAIADWKAGARPSASSAHMSTAAVDGEPQPVEELESGVVEMDEVHAEAEYAGDVEYEAQDGEYAEQAHASGEYAEQAHASGEYAEQAEQEIPVEDDEERY